MPLNPSGAKTILGNLFKAPTDDEATARAEWADAVETLCAAIVPASTTVSAAAATFESAITGFNAESAAQGLLETALVAFAATVGGGMAGYIAVPPVAPVGISFSNTDDAQAAADAIIDTIDTWLKTGTAAPSPPGTSFSPWS